MLIAMVGNIRPWKGQHVAIEALAALTPHERAAVELVFIGATAVGEAEYERELRALVKAAGLEKQVRFLGHRADVPDLIAASDVVLHASIEPEPFGLVVIEGLALGKVVVASRFGGPAEILGNDSTMTFSPDRPAELTRHLSTLIAEPDQRRELGESGRARAELFEISNTVRATTRIYDQLLGR
jgi:glycosyltransferase involved in cell wall biosynthesis